VGAPRRLPRSCGSSGTLTQTGHNILVTPNLAQFANERAAIDRAQATLDEAKQAAAATIARREQHTRLIEEAHQAGALNERERGKILERYAGEYATPDIDDAKKTLDLTWDQFWEALKKAERQLQSQPFTA
jgi:hypothetical protein